MPVPSAPLIFDDVHHGAATHAGEQIDDQLDDRLVGVHPDLRTEGRPILVRTPTSDTTDSVPASLTDTPAPDPTVVPARRRVSRRRGPGGRRARILDIVRNRPFTTVGELSRTFGVSEVTVRSDLKHLERGGQLLRIRGGAVPTGATGASDDEGSATTADPASWAPLVDPWSSGPSDVIDLRRGSGRDPRLGDTLTGSPRRAGQGPDEAADQEWRRLGHRAAAMVRSGDVVALTAGRGTLALAEALARRIDLQRLVAVTDSLDVAQALRAAPAVSIVVTGGTLGPGGRALDAPHAGPAASALRPDLVFLDCSWVSPHSVGVDDVEGSGNRERWIDRSARVVVLAPGRALDASGAVPVCPVTSAEMVLVEEAWHAAPAVELRQRGARMVRA